MNDILLNVQENTFYKKDGRLSLCRSNLEYLQQKIRSTLSFQLGEYFTDATIGVPYIPDFDSSKTDHLSLVVARIQERVAAIEGIAKLTSLETEYDETKRELNVKFTAVTTGGEEIEYENKMAVK